MNPGKAGQRQRIFSALGLACSGRSRVSGWRRCGCASRVDPALEAMSDRPWVLAFWHGTQWPLLAWRRRRSTVVLVSLSRDGMMQARALSMQGLRVVRGSRSRGGARGLASLVRMMKRDGVDAAFAVDGPRGPRGVVKGGAVVAARAAGAVLVPMAGAVRRGIVLRRAWDRFAIAWPFTRVRRRARLPDRSSGRRRRPVRGRARPRAHERSAAGRLGLDDGDGVDLDLRAARQRGHLDRGAGRVGGGSARP